MLCKQNVAETMEVNVRIFEEETDQEKCTRIVHLLTICALTNDRSDSEHQSHCHPQDKVWISSIEYITDQNALELYGNLS